MYQHMTHIKKTIGLVVLSSLFLSSACAVSTPIPEEEPGTETSIVTSLGDADLKNTMVALEYTGEPPGSEPVEAAITDIEFNNVYEGEDGTPLIGEVGLTFTDDASTIMASFTYDGMKADQLVVIKVYVNGVEAPSMRILEEWPQGAVRGAAEFAIKSGGLKFDNGYYWVELYVDSHLVQQNDFEMISAGGQGIDLSSMGKEELEQLLQSLPSYPGPESDEENY